MAMLTLFVKMKPPPGIFGLGLVAKEAALDVADGIYEPIVAEHIPGVANLLADALSRKADPKYKGKWSIPKALADVPCRPVPLREDSYYRTLVVQR